MGMFDNIRGFEPFYDTPVAFHGERSGGSISATYRACVIDGGYEDLFDEVADTCSKVHKITVHIPKHGEDGWVDSRTTPQIGDVIKLQSGEAYAVRSVNLLCADEFVMEARKK